MLDVHAEDLSFVTLWPEPEDGYAAWLAPKDEYRRLFRLLSRPGCLELLEHLHCHKRSYFVAQAVAKQLDTHVGMAGLKISQVRNPQPVLQQMPDRGPDQPTEPV